MDAEMQRHAREALDAIEVVLRAGSSVTHGAIQAAANGVIAFRNRAIEQHRAGAVSGETLDRANSLASLAYGAEFPLSGLHLRRLEQARDSLCSLLEASGE